MRRVVLTGLGCLSPCGINVEETCTNLLNGKSGITLIDEPGTEKLPVKIGAQVNQDWNIEKWKRQMPLPYSTPDDSVMAYYCAMQALEDAKYTPKTQNQAERSGIYFGRAFASLPYVKETLSKIAQKGYSKVNRQFGLQGNHNSSIQNLASALNFQGPSHVATTACAASLVALGESFYSIQRGETDLMLTGGVELCTIPWTMSGFHKIKTLENKKNHEPEKGSRPFDKSRSGFVLGDGAGVIVLEDYDHAKSRGAKIYGEILGCGNKQSALHLTKSDVNICKKVMNQSLQKANLPPEKIDIVNAHATSTYADEVEAEAIAQMFPHKPYVTAFKGHFAHLLGGSGMCEFVSFVKSMQTGELPPVQNIEDPCNENVNFVTEKVVGADVEFGMKNSFGFGGINTSVIFQKRT